MDGTCKGTGRWKHFQNREGKEDLMRGNKEESYTARGGRDKRKDVGSRRTRKGMRHS